jgi:5-methyltetrahydrofolate--homocysteine methyltransferase
MISVRQTLDDLLGRRILVLDGAIGTMIQQQQQLTEIDYRGERFLRHPRNLHGNHDVLSLTRPNLVSAIHHGYLEAGADIIKSNTFSSTAITQADYGLEMHVRELNAAAAQLAKAAAHEWSARTPDKPRFVAGSIGPTTCRLSDPRQTRPSGSVAMTADRVREAFGDQVRGLLDGGCDLLLVETIVDPLTTQMAIEAIKTVLAEREAETPLMLSVTLEAGGDRTQGGQTLPEFWNSVKRTRPLAIGINWSFGARGMMPALTELARVSETWVSWHPSAGVPDPAGRYDEPPTETAGLVREAAEQGLLNIVGGCCGTSPEHIREIANAVGEIPPRRLPD